MQILCFRKPLQVANFQPIDWSLFCVFSLLLVSLLWNVLLFCGPAMLHLSNTSASVRWGQKVAKEKGNMEKEKGSFPHVPLSACNSGLPRELWHINNGFPLLLRRRTIYRFFQHLQAICLWSWIWMCIFQDIAALWYCFLAFCFSRYSFSGVPSCRVFTFGAGGLMCRRATRGLIGNAGSTSDEATCQGDGGQGGCWCRAWVPTLHHGLRVLSICRSKSKHV